MSWFLTCILNVPTCKLQQEHQWEGGSSCMVLPAGGAPC